MDIVTAFIDFFFLMMSSLLPAIMQLVFGALFPATP
jgi:hypothetical protein